MEKEREISIKMREFLRDNIRLQTDFQNTDQSRGKAMPAIQKPTGENQKIISLPDWKNCKLSNNDFKDILIKRQSIRSYSEESLSLEELSWLLYATQGVRDHSPIRTFRTVPSAGNRHPFETYLVVFNVDGLKEGIYRYLPLDNALVFEKSETDLSNKTSIAALGQKMAGRSALTFIWTAIPYRTEWRYSKASAKVIAMDIGHICQNLYLACNSIACGTCEIAAYHQKFADELLELDGEEEFVIAMSPVGKLR
ncbi:MAG: SagB/ThcOx family dehydrogenase [Tissierellia bacterium]|nr:SagB/ThcOx family dehydrogenase [Tissierellia bacterium]